MKLSVIVPVYNVENYLKQCIDSILTQKHSALEIILVNDGSTDGSADLCDLFTKQDSRIRVIHQQNAGVSAARNAGIAAATGDYITFVDSDDWLSPLMYQEMLNTVRSQDQPEVVMCDFINERQDSSEKVTAEIRSGFYTKAEIVKELYPTLLVTDNLGRIPIISACTCMFKSSLLKNTICFDKDLRYSEDYLFMAEVMIAAKSFYYAKDQYFYHYRQYDESRSKKYRAEWWPTLVKLNKKLTDLLTSNKEYDFTYQLKLQLIHSAMFLTNAIFINDNFKTHKKSALLKEVFYEPYLKESFREFSLARQPLSLKIVLLLIKYRMIESYLLYRRLIQQLK